MMPAQPREVPNPFPLSSEEGPPSPGLFASWTRSKLPLVAASPDFLRKDRERRGFTLGQVAWRLGVEPARAWDLEGRYPPRDDQGI
jgi:hypothetical protein